jgi:hypothetical protein
MNRFEHQWQKLVALARQAPADPAAMPFGFATRVAAQAAALPAGTPWRSLERFAFRGLLVAGACSVAAIAFNYSGLLSDQSDDYASADTVGELLSLS